MYINIFVEQYPESCATVCRCYSNRHHKVLVANCSYSDLTQIPSSLPKELDWLIMSGNNISFLGEEKISNSSLGHLSKLNLQKNTIVNISSSFMKIFIQHSRLSFLDLSFNKLRNLPKNIKNLTFLQEVKISGNQFQCTCDNLWKKDWILNNSNVVVDYKNIKCKMKGGKKVAIVQMNEVDMGCIPDESFPIWKIAGIYSMVFFRFMKD